ncbi:MAG: hypothetical protein ACK42H_17250, partial [Planctomycetota bacterium]
CLGSTAVLSRWTDKLAWRIGRPGNTQPRTIEDNRSTSTFNGCPCSTAVLSRWPDKLAWRIGRLGLGYRTPSGVDFWTRVSNGFLN